MMQEYIYEWIQNLSVYMILMIAVMQLIPNKEYEKYIKFFTGLIFILLILSPLLKISNLKLQWEQLYRSAEIMQERSEWNLYDELEKYDEVEGITKTP